MRRRDITPLLLLCGLTAQGCSVAGEDMLADELHGEAGRGVLTGATIERQGDDFLLEWTTRGPPGRILVFTGTDPDVVNQLVADLQGENSALVTGLAPEGRHYFRIVGQLGSDVRIAERGLPQAGVVNLRDIGGYPTRFDDDAQVAWGTFFRSGFIPPTADQEFLATLGIRTVIDLRNPVELEQDGPTEVPGAAVLSRGIYDADALGVDPISPHFCLPGNQTPACYAAQEEFFGPNGENLRAFKAQAFRSIVTGVGPHPLNFGDTPREAVRTMLITLADRDQLPLVWADSGGEFRAGFGAAIALLLAGVPDDQVVADYALSTEFRRAVTEAQIAQLVGSGLIARAEYVLPQFTAFPEYMEGTLDELRRVYGSAVGYAHSLGITDRQIARIRAALLRD